MKISKEQVSSMLPESFTEQIIRVYSTDRDPAAVDRVRSALVAFCADNQCTHPRGTSVDGVTLMPSTTPKKTPMPSKAPPTLRAPASRPAPFPELGE